VIRVGVIGACGRMGLMVCRTVAETKDLALVAAIDRSKVGQRIGQMIGHPDVDAPVSDELDRLLEAEVDVAIDFTHPDVVMDDVRWCIAHAGHLVVGTTGITQHDLKDMTFRRTRAMSPMVGPNFALEPC
jgi:4-hydroxy-tetrahydrodipicolinate reductase